MIITKVYVSDKTILFNLSLRELPNDLKHYPAIEESNNILTEISNFNGWTLGDNNGSYWLIDKNKEMRDFPCNTNFYFIIKYAKDFTEFDRKQE